MLLSSHLISAESAPIPSSSSMERSNASVSASRARKESPPFCGNSENLFVFLSCHPILWVLAAARARANDDDVNLFPLRPSAAQVPLR